MSKIFKSKDEYCHIFDDKIVITKTPEIVDLIEDFGKSVNNVFKTLMVFFVSIPIFSILSVIFYKLGNVGLTFYTAAFVFVFLAVAIYTMFFTSATPSIKRDCIDKIKIRKWLLNDVVVIFYTEFGRQKRRILSIDKDKIDNVAELLLSEKLIEKSDIQVNGFKTGLITYVVLFTIIFPFSFFLKGNNNIQTVMGYYGAVVIIIGLILLIFMIKRKL